jgi:uncharacterized protein YjiS (DUF1127 family)
MYCAASAIAAANAGNPRARVYGRSLAVNVTNFTLVLNFGAGARRDGASSKDHELLQAILKIRVGRSLTRSPRNDADGQERHGRNVMAVIETEADAIGVGDRSWRTARAIVAVACCRMIAVLTQWRRKAAQRRSLHAHRNFDDHMLADIGLTRSPVGPRTSECFFY